MFERTAELGRKLAHSELAIRQRVLEQLRSSDVRMLKEVVRTDWSMRARAKQLLPPGDWRWLALCGGRGFGKSRAGAEAIRAAAESGHHSFLSVVGPTWQNIVRDCLTGPSGLLNISPSYFFPQFVSSRNELRYPAHPRTAVSCRVALLSADKPDRIRGSAASFVWLDEIQSWRNARESFDMVDLSLRIRSRNGDAPRGIVTFTPKTISAFVRDFLLGPRDPVSGKRTPRADLKVVTGSTMENRMLPEEFVASMLKEHREGTTGYTEELMGLLVDIPENALWTYELINDYRVESPHAAIEIVIVGVDPSRSEFGMGDEAGIVAVGRAGEHIYVLEDGSLRGSVHAWATKAAGMGNKWRAPEIIYEGNRVSPQMGEVIASIAGQTRTKWAKTAAVGPKQVRAAPVLALYQGGRVHHVGTFERLEEEMCTWDSADPKAPSPNRLDALVHAILAIAPGGGSYRPPLVVL